MLTEDEKAFLELPQSKLAIKLAELDKEAGKKSFWRKLWGGRNRLVAISAFLAAIAPLYQLNVTAINLAQNSYATNKIITRVEQLLLIDAASDAQQELTKAKELSPNDVKIQELQALIDLEGILRKNQDVRSLQTLEFRYADVIPNSPKALYLLGSAYITADIDKASKLIAEAEKKVKKESRLLRIQLASAHIQILARKYDKDSDQKWHDEAKLYFEKAQTIINENPNEDFSKGKIPLLLRYSFIKEQQGKNGLVGSEKEGHELSSNAFSLALASGNHTSIGKSAANLATKLKEEGKVQEAFGIISFAIENARMANDERGLYHDLYTLGQIYFELGNFKDALKSYSESLNLSIKNNDTRLCVFNNINMAKTYIVLGQYDMAIGSIAQAEFVTDSVEDKYGKLEAKALRLFHGLFTSIPSSREKLSEEFLALAADAKNLKVPNDLEYWSRYLINKATVEEYYSCERRKDCFDFVFGQKVLKNIQAQ